MHVQKISASHLTGYIARNYSTISQPAESTSNLKVGTEVAWKKYFAEISPLRVSYDSKGCCQTHHTVEHTAPEETVLRSSKSVLHSCSFFNFVVLVVTRLEAEE